MLPKEKKELFPELDGFTTVERDLLLDRARHYVMVGERRAASWFFENILCWILVILLTGAAGFLALAYIYNHTIVGMAVAMPIGKVLRKKHLERYARLIRPCLEGMLRAG